LIFGISNFRFYQTTVNDPAKINANKCIRLISNLGDIEPLNAGPLRFDIMSIFTPENILGRNKNTRHEKLRYVILVGSLFS